MSLVGQKTEKLTTSKCFPLFIRQRTLGQRKGSNNSFSAQRPGYSNQGTASTPEKCVSIAVCTENLIRVDDVMESPKLVE